MPFLLAGMAGFLLSAISPTVVVTGMLDLQKKGFGAEKGEGGEGGGERVRAIGSAGPAEEGLRSRKG